MLPGAIMRKRLWTAAIVVVALGAAAAWWGAASRPGEQARAQAARPAPEPRVVAQAQIVPIDGIIEVRPLIEGKVLRVLVQPGDRVQANQLLAEIESGIPRAAVEQREADVKAASERLALAAEGVRPEDREALAAAAEAARNEAELAQDRWQRQRRLFEQGFISQQALTEAERSALAAQARDLQVIDRIGNADFLDRLQFLDLAQLALKVTPIIHPVEGLFPDLLGLSQ